MFDAEFPPTNHVKHKPAKLCGINPHVTVQFLALVWCGQLSLTFTGTQLYEQLVGVSRSNK